MEMVTFSVLGTPIGNLEDITLRALNALRAADLVLCEDTRTTKKLFDKYDIHIKTMSYHVHSKLSRTEEIVRILREACINENIENFRVILVSDAGTPGISDPGSELVGRIRSELSVEIAAGSVKIEALPGPSAITAALSIAGVPCADFVFLGFLPHKKGRQTLFREIAESERTVVFYESPHRIMKTLEALRVEVNAEKKITICRELTKIFEEVVAGSAEEVFQYFTSHPDKVRGEFVVIVSG
ncbi:MAG: 16S rRNA (cytidine(1402)-2'-O)-methyltransferase [Candidatus Taylorbacteria bacterium]